MPKWVAVGRITAPHGLKGEVKVQSFMAEPEHLFSHPNLFTKAKQLITPVAWRWASKGFIVRFSGIDNRSSAEALVGQDLFIDRAALPQLATAEQFYHVDLLGLKVIDAEGHELGRVVACPNYGAGDILELDNGLMLPFSAAVIRHIDPNSGCITVQPPEFV